MGGVIKREGPVAPWRQIAAIYREQIEKGQLKPGDRLPSIRASRKSSKWPRPRRRRSSRRCAMRDWWSPRRWARSWPSWPAARCREYAARSLGRWRSRLPSETPRGGVQCRRAGDPPGSSGRPARSRTWSRGRTSADPGVGAAGWRRDGACRCGDYARMASMLVRHCMSVRCTVSSFSRAGSRSPSST